MTNREFAQRWAQTRTSDLTAHVALYAPDKTFVVEIGKVDDHMEDSINDRTELARRLAYYSNADADSGKGVHTITVIDVFEGDGHIFIHWDYAIEHLTSFHGVAADGKTLSTVGSTFLEFDPEGRIVQEATIINEAAVSRQLGLPIITPHYWEEGFDFASLAG
ncbi:hypothetical protein [Mycolicibacterium septicum]|uniref:hypothetical protein n=1 Tax=Mycolicibacterium septicum TaxID=98668 RepID=UPI00235F8957|nr:hypothetical protein [Mycolicibacterium septicum]